MPVRKHSTRGYWEVDVEATCQEGEHQGKTERVRKKADIQTKRAARDEASDIRQAIRNGSYWEEDEKEEEIPSFRQMADLWEEDSRLAASTMHGYTSRLRNWIYPVIGDQKIDEITPAHLKQVVTYCEEHGIAYKTCKNAVTAARTVLQDAIERDLLEDLPDYDVPSENDYGNGIGDQDQEMADTPPYLTEKQAKKLIENAHPRVELMVKIALWSGLRFGEMAALRWTNIDFRNDRIKVRIGWTGDELRLKSDESKRKVPLTPQLQEALLDYRADWEPKGEWEGYEDWLFQRPEAPFEPWDTNYVGYCIRQSYRDAGLAGQFDRLGFHNLRHTFATTHVHKGTPLPHVQQLCGHKSYDTTLQYVHRDDSELEASMEALHGFAC